MYQVDVGIPNLKREKSRPIKIRDMETDPNEHMLSIYAEHMLECRACGRRFEKMPQLAGHYRMHAQTNLLKALAEKLYRQNMLLEKILLELESIHNLLEKLNIVEAKIEEESVVSKIAPATLEAGEKEEAGLPSFLGENLWVGILSKRSTSFISLLKMLDSIIHDFVEKWKQYIVERA